MRNARVRRRRNEEEIREKEGEKRKCKMKESRRWGEGTGKERGRREEGCIGRVGWRSLEAW